MVYHDYGWRRKMHINDYCKAFSENEGERHHYKHYYKYLEESCTVVDLWALRNSVHDIPNQSNSWSCGVTASARAAAIVAMPIWDYQAYHNGALTHSLGTIECGPGPGNLYRMMARGMNQSRAPHGFGFGLDITNDWAPQEALLNASLSKRRPMLVLFEGANRVLHWAVVVGRENHNQSNLLMLNSDGCLYLMHLDELRRRMDLGNHIANSFPIATDRVGRYNSISCTWGDLPHDTGGHDKRHQSNRDAKLRGDHSTEVNLLRTMCEAPIVIVSGGPQALLNGIRGLFL